MGMTREIAENRLEQEKKRGNIKDYGGNGTNFIMVVGNNGRKFVYYYTTDGVYESSTRHCEGRGIDDLIRLCTATVEDQPKNHVEVNCVPTRRDLLFPLLEAKHISRKTVCKAIGRSGSYLTMRLCGENGSGTIPIDEAMKIQRVFGINIDDYWDNGNRKPAEDVEEKTKRFVPPTYEQVAEYCKERKNNVNPRKFFDFYESKGWVVGKSKMKDWKACVRTWEINNSNQWLHEETERKLTPTEGVILPGIALKEAYNDICHRVDERKWIAIYGYPQKYQQYFNDWYRLFYKILATGISADQIKKMTLDDVRELITVDPWKAVA